MKKSKRLKISAFKVIFTLDFSLKFGIESIISQKKKSISTNVKTNSNDKSEGSSLMNITDAIAMHSYFSDHESPDSSKN